MSFNFETALNRVVDASSGTRKAPAHELPANEVKALATELKETATIAELSHLRTMIRSVREGQQGSPVISPIYLANLDKFVRALDQMTLQ